MTDNFGNIDSSTGLLTDGTTPSSEPMLNYIYILYYILYNNQYNRLLLACGQLYWKSLKSQLTENVAKLQIWNCYHFLRENGLISNYMYCLTPASHWSIVATYRVPLPQCITGQRRLIQQPKLPHSAGPRWQINRPRHSPKFPITHQQSCAAKLVKFTETKTTKVLLRRRTIWRNFSA